jgi:hypothetical protein
MTKLDLVDWRVNSGTVSFDGWLNVSDHRFHSSLVCASSSSSSFTVLESCNRRYQRHRVHDPKHREFSATTHVVEGVFGHAVVPAGLPKFGDSDRRGKRVLDLASYRVGFN